MTNLIAILTALIVISIIIISLMYIFWVKVYDNYYKNVKAGDYVHYFVNEDKINAIVIVRKGTVLTLQYTYNGEVNVIKVNIRDTYPILGKKY